MQQSARWRRPALAAAAWLLAALPALAEPFAAMLPAEPAPAASTALVLLPPGGWAKLAPRIAPLAGMHALVLAAELPGGAADCDALAERLLARARSLQKAAGAAARAPVVIGIGPAAGLALRLAAHHPAAVKGLVTLAGPEQPLACAPELPRGKAPVRWHLAGPAGAPQLGEGRAGTRRYAPDEWNPDPLIPAYLALAGMDHAYDTAEEDGIGAGLPVTLHAAPAGAAGRRYAIFLSGDGGWARFDDRIADILATRGMPVLGISSLKYLWTARSPAEIAADLARLDAAARTRLGRDRPVLIGFSMGASVLPFALPHLPPEMADRLAGVVLLSPEARTGFEIVVGGWLGRQTGSADVVAALGALPPGMKVLCLHGETDAASACPGAAETTRVTRPGGHHMENDYPGLAAEIEGFLAP
ncbi:AcvB/VirJ family lysyl-phosphatidylglycerol hydrolase [Poseidonocella sp. HB161398]|uniref:AcvB/VirJ family lysyl-phosphatidylglycerol hydrolase n=1 Tax=Poseidonocella sp. HB161398 TaxID=2320855 RepID=UPI001108CBC6|nr:AcvB/VirJ family lysyl-phosphatidylglycerol hydrolase [Poseidonocella sp. HB161398]